jgi:hypothetical protein
LEFASVILSGAKNPIGFSQHEAHRNLCWILRGAQNDIAADRVAKLAHYPVVQEVASRTKTPQGSCMGVSSFRRMRFASRMTICLLALNALGDAPAAPEKTPSKKHPALLLTAFGEVTEQAEPLAPASPTAPIYYAFASASYRPSGNLPRETPIQEEKVTAMLRRTLADQGYLVADETHPPTIGLVFFWGPHAAVDTSTASQEQILRNLLDRAALVGGDKFASELVTAFRESARIAEASARPMGGLGAAGSVAAASAMADPVVLFRRRDPLNETLLDHAETSCYYIVVSAYEYQSCATPQKKLLWRVRATVNSHGVSQAQIFPTLVAAASRVFAKETAKPELTRLRANEPLVDYNPE